MVLPGKDNSVFYDMRQVTHAITTFDLHLGYRNLRWCATHCLVIMHVSMKFHESLFKRFKLVIWTRKTTSFDLY